jgi:DNA-binding transcriptional ArsR family regulator
VSGGRLDEYMSQNAGLFPHRPQVDETERDRRTLTIGTEEAAHACACLASETATRILAHLFDEPTTASDVADRVDTSVQNVHYHLDRLVESGLVRVVDTWYSSRGVEMDVYAPAHDEFVLAPASQAADGAVDESERLTEGAEPPLAAGRHS